MKLISNPPPQTTKSNGIDRHHPPAPSKKDKAAAAQEDKPTSSASTPRTSASLARLNQPRKSNTTPQTRTGMVEQISTLSVSRQFNDSIDDMLSERELRFAVNADKTLSPERPPLGSDGTLSFDSSLARSLPPPYTSRAESTLPILNHMENEEEEVVSESTSSLPLASSGASLQSGPVPPRPPRSDIPS